MPIPPAITHARARVAHHTRFYPADDPRLTDARRNLAEAQISTYVQNIIDAAPPLTDAQKTRLCELLRPTQQSVGAELASNHARDAA